MSKRIRRVCAFCGAASSFSKEHVWPQWLAKYTTVDCPTRMTASASVSHDTEGIADIRPLDLLERPGSVLGFQVREVCERCNNGWMSRLEAQAGPLLVPLMRGLRVQITPADATVIATWATKSTYRNEYIGVPGIERRPTPATSAARRRELMDLQVPPAQTRVWAARHIGRFHVDMRSAEMEVVKVPDPTTTDAFKVLTTAISVEQLTLLVWSTDCTGTEPPRLHPAEWLPLWPQPRDLRWPPPRSIPDAEVERAALHHHDRYRPVASRGVRLHPR